MNEKTIKNIKIGDYLYFPTVKGSYRYSVGNSIIGENKHNVYKALKLKLIDVIHEIENDKETGKETKNIVYVKPDLSLYDKDEVETFFDTYGKIFCSVRERKEDGSFSNVFMCTASGGYIRICQEDGDTLCYYASDVVCKTKNNAIKMVHNLNNRIIDYLDNEIRIAKDFKKQAKAELKSFEDSLIEEK